MDPKNWSLTSEQCRREYDERRDNRPAHTLVAPEPQLTDICIALLRNGLPVKFRLRALFSSREHQRERQVSGLIISWLSDKDWCEMRPSCWLHIATPTTSTLLQISATQ